MQDNLPLQPNLPPLQPNQTNNRPHRPLHQRDELQDQEEGDKIENARHHLLMAPE